MGAFATRKKDSGSSPAGAPASGNCSVAQARLNWIVKPDGQFFRAYVRWFNRISHNPEAFTKEVLEARVREIGPEARRLTQDLENPPEAWTGRDWLAAKEREQHLLGQMQAIEEAGKRRTYTKAAPKASSQEGRAWGRAGRTSAPSPSPPPPAPPTAATPACAASPAAWDPFASE